VELRQLERFLAVADLGSLAEVARREGLTQQGISASIAALERELGGVRLFDRSPGGVTRLTDIGHALLPHARAQLAADQRARRDIANLVNARSGTVTLGIGETFAGDIIASVVTEILADRPDLRINLVEDYSERLLPRLYAGEFDFLAAGVSNITLPTGFEARVVYSAQDVVACRHGHPLAGRRGLSVSDLVGYPWLVPYSRPSDADVITEAFVAAGVAPPVRFLGSDAFRIGVQIMAVTDLLIMASPALLRSRVMRESLGVELLDVPVPTVTRNASLIASSQRPLTPAAQILYDAIVRRVAEGRA
jgi:LysR family transcriptional regulator of gallate degradation